MDGCLGVDRFTAHFVQFTVSTWVEEVQRLANIAESQPQDAFTALAHGLSSGLTYLTRVTSFNADYLKPLEDVIDLFQH